MFERMAGVGMTIEQMGAVWGRTGRTLTKRMKEDPQLKEAIERGRAQAHMKVANVAYKMAISGQTPAMTMFWLKARARWKETRVTEHKGLTLEDIVAGSNEDGEVDGDDG